jgi:sugar phosphate isomerase/epimerase
MPPPKNLTRREALRTAALGALAFPLLNSRVFGAQPAAPAPAAPAKPERLRLGVTSYSTRELTLDQTITTMGLLRITNLALYRKHCEWETASVDECRAVGQKLKAAGLQLHGSGVINLPNDEAKVRQAFVNVRAAGMTTMVCKPEIAALPLVEKFVKEFDQKLAIHNHGPEDKVYPTPESIWSHIKPLDARIGLCIDVGHTMRAGGDPIADIRRYAARLYDLHLKDSLAVVGTMKDIPIEVGAGRMDIRGILRALLDIKYQGVVAFEYEKVAANPVTGLAESVGYVRGLLAGIG